MATGFALRIALLFCATVMVFTQTADDCPCNNPLSGAKLGQVLATESCEGQCDLAQRREIWSCMTQDNVTITNCTRHIACVNEQSCLGTWSKWGNAGRCNSTCGPGFRDQTRDCHDANELQSGNFRRTTACAGGMGRNTQSRSIACRRIMCVGSSSVSSTSTATTTTTTTATFSSSTTTAASTSRPEVKTTASELTEEQPTAIIFPDDVIVDGNPPDDTINAGGEKRLGSNSVDSLTLAAVLGSIALVCLAIVIVVTVVVKRRRANTRTSNTRRRSSDNSENRRKRCTDSGPYEVIAPSLPPLRQTSLNSSPGHVTAHNLLYSRHGSGRAFNHEVYLQPLPSPTRSSFVGSGSYRFDDPTYVCIDDYRK